jgi:hypothetical protein
MTTAHASQRSNLEASSRVSRAKLMSFTDCPDAELGTLFFGREPWVLK